MFKSSHGCFLHAIRVLVAASIAGCCVLPQLPIHMSSRRGILILLLRYVAKLRVRCIHWFSSGTLRRFIWSTCKTESTKVTGGSFREARSTWTRLSSSTSTDKWYLVGDCPEDVEDKVVGKQRSPGTDGHNA